MTCHVDNQYKKYTRAGQSEEWSASNPMTHYNWDLLSWNIFGVELTRKFIADFDSGKIAK